MTLNSPKKPGFFQAIAGSFSNAGIYNQFSKIRIGSAIVFLALFLFLLVFLGTCYVTFKMGVGLSEAAEDYNTVFPEIRIKNGEVLVDREMPVIVEEKDNKDTIVIIDTSGGITNLDNYKDYEKGILLTKNKLIYKKNSFDVRTYDLSEVRDFTLNRDKLLEWKKALVVILFPVILLFWFMYKLFITAIQVGIFTLAARVIADSKSARLQYNELSNIAMLAIIPPLIIGMVFFMLSQWIKIPGLLHSLIFLGIYIGYLFFAVSGIERIRREEAIASDNLAYQQASLQANTGTYPAAAPDYSAVPQEPASAPQAPPEAPHASGENPGEPPTGTPPAV